MLQQNRKLADEYVRLLQQAVASETLLVAVRRGFEVCKRLPAALISGGSFVSVVLTQSISQQPIVIVKKSFPATTYLRGLDPIAVAEELDVYESV